LKTIKAYYTATNKLYVQKEILVLNQHGIDVEAIDATTLTKNIITPSFVVFKDGGLLSKLDGKFTPGQVLVWVQKYIKETI
jgi:hypothetical protein